MADGKASPSDGSLVILSGLPGAGKTTFARALCNALGAIHIESDAIRREIAPEPRYDADEHARVFATVEVRAAEALAARRAVIIDATNLTSRDRRRFFRLGAKKAGVTVAVRLLAPEPTVRERLATPREGWSQAGLAIYDLMRRKAQPFNVPVVLVDTRFPTAGSVALVAALLEVDEA